MATTKKSKKAAKKSSKKTRKARGRVQTGQVPPYGEVIRGAIARGDMQGMRDAAASARKWVDDLQAALAELERAMRKEA